MIAFQAAAAGGISEKMGKPYHGQKTKVRELEIQPARKTSGRACVEGSEWSPHLFLPSYIVDTSVQKFTEVCRVLFSQKARGG